MVGGRAEAVSLLVIIWSGFACEPLFGAFIVECVDLLLFCVCVLN